MKVIVLGSTGLVGKNVLKLLVQLESIESVYCPVRVIPDLKELNIVNGISKIKFDKVDFEQINEWAPKKFENFNAVICSLGTTLKLAGSKKAQEKIDLGLPLTFAAIAKNKGIKHFLCVSAMGANSHSPFFYNRLKGMLEEGLTMIGFEMLTLVRPSLLLGKHKDKRKGEEFLQKLLGMHPEWIPEYIRPIHAETVSAHLVASLLNPPINHICRTDGIKGKRIIYNRILAITKVKELF